MVTFTVFTPTYNRAHTLHRVYDSLRGQACRDFEWVVIDDGSSDDTESRVRRWKAEADFPIRYVFQENRGKHFASNRAAELAQGEFVICHDSDDACVPDALERFRRHWEAIPPSDRPSFAGVTACCVTPDGRPVGRPLRRPVIDSDFNEIRYRYRSGGERWACVRRDVLREFPFPEILPGEYLPEGIVWSAIARRYKTRFVSDGLRVYYTDSPSLVTQPAPGRNAAGGRTQHLHALNEDIGWFRHAPREFLRSALHYARFSFHKRIPSRVQRHEIVPRLGRLLWLVALPAAWLVYRADRNRHLSILRRQKRPLRFLASRLLMRLELSRLLTIRRPDYRLRFFPTSISAALWIDPTDRGADAKFYNDFLRGGDVVVDVGANIGTTALSASRRVGPDGRVVAIEAHPAVCTYLRRNVELNDAGNVSVIHAAAGDRHGPIMVSSSRFDDQNRVLDSGGVAVPMESLDGLLRGLSEVTLLKVDVEGYELFVLRGAAETLSRTRCVYLECWEPHVRRYEYTFEDVFDLLTGHGFHVLHVTADGRAYPATRRFRAPRLEDLVAVRDVDEFLARTGYRLDGRG